MMIVIGLLFFLYFFYWFFWVQTFESTVLYVLLSISIFYKALRVLHEWYHLSTIKVEEDKTPDKPYTVDVFTTYCPGESKEMVKKTLMAIKNIRYPHGTFLCCEGHDSEFEKFCLENDINYVFRTERTNAKAGNINNGLKQSSAELVLILDPDHAPFPEFLDETIGHFNDPKIGFVQVVQSYGNQSDGFVAAGAAEQTYLFYGPILMGMNGKGTVQAIGANCLFRREALDTIGGHAAGLCEDLHTSMLLHAQGWKSVYLPKVLSKGTTPASFEGFYKQQLKWSRGSFELLFEVLPKIFKKLNWKQRIHYTTMTLYFFIGVVAFIDFTIPVATLFTSKFPVSSDVLKFFISLSGFGLITWLIRQKSKQFLLEPHERTLFWKSTALIGSTWLAYFRGFIYAIFGKKVPYIPSEKGGGVSNELKIQIPNIAIIFITCIAIVYGLRRDFTPFSIIMSGFGLVNISILMTSVVHSFRKFSDHVLNRVISKLLKWIQRNVVFMVSKMAFLFVLILLLFEGFVLTNKGNSPVNDYRIRNEIGGYYNVGGKYNGIYSTTDEPIDSTCMSIISLYVAWGDYSFPKGTVQKIIAKGFIPMITWEPWSSEFKRFEKDSLLSREIGICKAITSGRLDFYLERWAEEVKLIDAPVFIRFAHEMGNPQYGWKNNSPRDYVQSWRYVVDFFKRKKVHNVAWVWNPWRDFESYYPGNKWVDWIGLTLLNYGELKKGDIFQSFYSLYSKFDFYTNVLKKPVMVAEFGSTDIGGDKETWFRESKRMIQKSYKEINAVVYFNSNQDNHWPGMQRSDAIDWTIEGSKCVYDDPVDYKRKKIRKSENEWRSLPDNIKGVNYNIKNSWRYNFIPPTRSQMEFDMVKIKELGCNTICRMFGDFYDYNVLNISKEHGLGIIYGIDTKPYMDYTSQSVQDSLTDLYMEQVNNHKSHNNIKLWQIGDNTHKQLEMYFTQPYLYYVREAYLDFVNRLAIKIKEIDSRPVSVSLYADQMNDFVKRRVSNVDAIALEGSEQLLMEEEIPYYYASVGRFDWTDKYFQNEGLNKGKSSYLFFRDQFYIKEKKISSFEEELNLLKDKQSSGFVYSNLYENNFHTKTWSGLLSQGRLENQKFGMLKSAFKGSGSEQEYAPIDVRILNDNFPYFSGREYHFNANLGSEMNNASYEWILCESDVVELERFHGKTIEFEIPEGVNGHLRLYLYVTQGDKIYQTSKPLILG